MDSAKNYKIKVLVYIVFILNIIIVYGDIRWGPVGSQTDRSVVKKTTKFLLGFIKRVLRSLEGWKSAQLENKLI